MYKYEIVANEIAACFDRCRRKGMDSITVCAREIEKELDISRRCGAAKGTRYPLICQAMHNVPRYRGVAHEGPDPSSTFTVTYDLKHRKFF